MLGMQKSLTDLTEEYFVHRSQENQLGIAHWERCIPAKYTGFPGIIPGFSVSSRNPGIYCKFSRGFSVSSGIPELVLGLHSLARADDTYHRTVHSTAKARTTSEVSFRLTNKVVDGKRPVCTVVAHRAVGVGEGDRRQ